jgi:hypothetical protein
MFANGPPCTSVGVYLSDCTRSGLSASFISTVIEPCAVARSLLVAVEHRYGDPLQY